jgi:mRNA interferase HigB
MGAEYTLQMRIIALSTLRDFWQRHPDSEQALQACYHDAKAVQWVSPNDIKQRYANASIISNSRVVFNIKGNRYRLIVAVKYASGIVYIRFIGTHADYDKVDAKTV